MRFLILSLCFLVPATLPAQTLNAEFGFSDTVTAAATETSPTPQEETRGEMKGRNGLRRGIIKAGRSALKKGEISRREFNRIRVATMLPAVMEQIEDAAIMQMVASGEDTSEFFEVGADGAIDRDGIDWDGLLDFLERLIPIIVQLINIFAGVG